MARNGILESEEGKEREGTYFNTALDSPSARLGGLAWTRKTTLFISLWFMRSNLESLVFVLQSIFVVNF